MSEKKELFNSLFGSKKQKKGCCNMEIVEVQANDCCDACCTPKTETERNQADDSKD